MAFNAAITVLPSVPSQIPTLNGIPIGVCSGEAGPPVRAPECHESFCVEKPLMPTCARMLGNDAGNPKQSGSMYSALVLPKSWRKYSLPYRTCRMMDSAHRLFTSFSSIDEPDGNHRPAATYF